jgi:adenylate kinase
VGDEYDVVYLTGAPAAGKSSVAEQLKHAISPIEVFNYGQELTRYLANKTGSLLGQDELREQSSKVITPEDVEALDSTLLKRIGELRSRTNVVIDTHAVTKESYGFRVTPFSLRRFGELRPTKIVVLYTSPEIAISRIGADPGGRPMITAFEAGFHSALQASVALCYGTSLGVPVYFLDSDKTIPELLEWFRCHIKAAARPPGGVFPADQPRTS